MLEGILTGIAASEIAERIKKHLHRFTEQPQPEHDNTSHDLLLSIANATNASAGLLLSMVPPEVTDRELLERYVVLKAIDIAPTQISREGRPHLSIFTAVAFTLSVQVSGMPISTHSLLVGWNLVDLPDGTAYGVASGGTERTVFIRKSDYPLGVSI